MLKRIIAPGAKICKYIRKLKFVIILLTLLFAIIIIISKRNVSKKIIVIEEHHEALYYWYHSLNLGLITKDSLLIHIDGHADLDIPFHIPGMPIFQYPPDDDILQLYLQKNDVFIKGGIIMGLLSHVIWIWPTWDLSLMNDNVSYLEESIKLGTYYNYYKNEDDYDMDFCQCTTDDDEEENGSENCFILNPNNNNVTAVGKGVENEEINNNHLIAIDSNLCDVKKTFRQEIVSDEKFIKKVTVEYGEWLSSNKTVVLDIDEDFFGCQIASKDYTGDINFWNHMLALDVLLKPIFCPKRLHQEVLANNFMQTLLANVRVRVRSRKELSYKLFRTETESSLIKLFLLNPSLFCVGNDYDLKKVWNPFLTALLTNTSSLWLDYITKYGFCVSNPMKVLKLENYSSLVICHGANPPQSKLVYNRILNESEYENQLIKFDLILKALQFHGLDIKLVTVARSVRDGYTVREQQKRIEADIVQRLAGIGVGQAFGWELIYDAELLGSRSGWSNRSFYF